MIPNKFYTSFDQETLEPRKPDYRTPFEVDRDRIIHSYAFRRLQAKTQVFTTGEYDFYRTRLTHTIEVSQVGRSICTFLNRTTKGFDEEFYIDPTLVEAICLAHDIGHAPFGHMGEEKLNELMDKFGGFEGNAQTLRLLSETIWPGLKSGERRGMCPTRALLDGVLKYKDVRRRAATKRKKFIYDDQEKCLHFVHKGLPRKFLKMNSIESQIMDWADEIAYSTADVLDGAYARFITPGRLKSWKSPKRDDAVAKELIDSIEKEDLQRFRAHKIGELIKSVTAREDAGSKTEQTNRYRYQLDIPPKSRAEQECLKQISCDLVFDSPGLQQLQYKAQALVEQLFNVLRINYLLPKPPKHLLSLDEESTLAAGKNKRERARRLCDYISGMSDDYIVRTCRRLTDPEFGSIVDLV